MFPFLFDSPRPMEAPQLIRDALNSADLDSLTFLNSVGLLSQSAREEALTLLLRNEWNAPMFDRLMALTGSPPDWRTLFLHLNSATREGVIAHFLQCGLDPRMRFSDGRSPMLLCILTRAQTPLRELLASGASADERDRFGRTLLMLAVRRRVDVDMIRLLVAAGADPNATDDAGLSVLAHAILSACDFINPLLELGADPRRPCGGRTNAAVFAAMENRESAYGHLQKHSGRGLILQDLEWVLDRRARHIVFSTHGALPEDAALDAALRESGNPRRLVSTLLLDTPTRMRLAWVNLKKGLKDDDTLDSQYWYVVQSSNAKLPPEAAPDAIRFLHYCAFLPPERLDALLTQLPPYPGAPLDWLDDTGAPVRFNPCFSGYRHRSDYGGGSNAPRVSLLNLGLHVAVRYANPAIFARLKSLGANFDSHFYDGQCLAAGAPDFATLKALVECGSPFTEREPERPSALEEAVLRDDADAVNFLLDHGVSTAAYTNAAGMKKEDALRLSVRYGCANAFRAIATRTGLAGHANALTPADTETLTELACANPHPDILFALPAEHFPLRALDANGRPVWLRLFDPSVVNRRDLRPDCALLLLIVRRMLREGILTRDDLGDPFGTHFAALAKEPSFPTLCIRALLCIFHFCTRSPGVRQRLMIKYAAHSNYAHLEDLGFAAWFDEHHREIVPWLLGRRPPRFVHQLLEQLDLPEADWHRLLANPALFPAHADSILENPKLPPSLRALLEVSEITTPRREL